MPSWTRPEGVTALEPLARHTSLKVGGPADLFAVARSANDLERLSVWARAAGLPIRVIGGGSNLLIADDGVEGLVIKMQANRTQVLDVHGEPVLRVEAGALLANVARRVSKAGLTGLEWATNIPGTVGGAVVNNAGAFGGETAACLLGATVVGPGEIERRVTVQELKYGYRDSALKRHAIGDLAVTSADLRLQRGSATESTGLVARYQAERTRSQPRQLSAGSVFANPPGDFAGRAIEACGLKGKRVGGAVISSQHANFIVNSGGARAHDVWQLMRTAQQRVFQEGCIWLRPEIELLGRWSNDERSALLSPPGSEALR